MPDRGNSFLKNDILGIYRLGAYQKYPWHIPMQFISLVYEWAKISATFLYRSRYCLEMECTWWPPGISSKQ